MVNIRKIVQVSSIFVIAVCAIWGINPYRIKEHTIDLGTSNTLPAMKGKLSSVPQYETERLTRMVTDLRENTQRLNQQQREIKRILARLDVDKEVTINTHSIENDEAYLEPEADDEHTLQRVHELDTAFANESIDKDWSSAAIDEVSNVLSQFDTLALVDLDCQSTFCKINLEQANVADSENFLDSFIFDLSWETNNYTQSYPNEDGSITTVVYLSRDGHHLPME